MMDIVENFHFLRPLCFLAVIPALWLAFKLLRTQNQASEWQSEISNHLLPYLIEGKNSTASRLPIFGLIMLWLVIVIALAGPTWEKLPQALNKDSDALVILFDLSPSMDVKDLTPSRLVRARLKLIDLLDARKEGQASLVAYSGEAHVVTPLTDDVETIKNMIPSLSPHTMPLPGSNAEMALDMANTLLKDAGVSHGTILFVSDGIASSAIPELKRIQRMAGHKVLVWGFGTEDGGPIQLGNGGFARNKRGEIVVAKLDDKGLSSAAIAMNGVYIPFSDLTTDIGAIQHHSKSMFNEDQREVEREFDQWAEFGPWLVLFCLPLIALSFRRGLILCFLLSFAVLQSPEVYAANSSAASEKNSSSPGTSNEETVSDSPSLWTSLWQTKNQQAQRALDNGDAGKAAQLFKLPEHKATANFRAQNYEEAAKLFKQNEQASSWFNKGTALTHAGNYDEALKAYDKALALQTDYNEAQHNKEITLKLKELEQQNQENQDGEPEQGEQNQDQQQAENQKQQKSQDSDQQQANQQSQEQQNSEQQQSEQNDSDQQSAQQAENQSDDKKALEDYQQQLTEAQKEKEEQEQEQKAQQIAQEQQQDQQSENKQTQVMLDPEQMAKSEDQQKLEQLLRRVPDDPGRLLRNKFHYEAQQRRRQVDTSSWNTPDNPDEERW